MKPSHATAAAATGTAGAALVVASWAPGLAHITVPADVAAAIIVLASPFLHVLAVNVGAWLAKQSA
jgi:hypothetical protein